MPTERIVATVQSDMNEMTVQKTSIGAEVCSCAPTTPPVMMALPTSLALVRMDLVDRSAKRMSTNA